MHEKNCSVDRIILGGVGPLWEVMSNIVQKLISCPSIDPNIEEGILEAKTECYAKDKVKSPRFFRSFYDDF